jgi:hypothetical protein
MPRIIIALITVLLLSGCGSKDETAETPDPMEEREELLTAAAHKIVGDFSRELKSELLGAINAGGPAHAISVCSELAPAIANQYSREGNLLVRRVSDRNRNPNNIPDSLQAVLLERFRQSDSLEEVIVWKDYDSLEVFAYHKPIWTGQLCLNCHGPREKLNAEVIQTLEEKYPNDDATGFQEGDLRGMFVVEIVWPRAEPIVKEMLGEDPRPKP